uniref:mRNA-capping enzyme subunit beta n=1 Tax=Schizophyllum commune (strain H4-8 / FGSC 9210) TaxID=578458 RepID=D8PXD9_SCHCM
MSSALPPLSLSILGVEPIDEFILEIADFIHHTIMTRPSDHDLGVTGSRIEVEAKIGVIKERGMDMRLRLPVLVETDPGALAVHFESNMSMKQHQHFNHQLNKLHALSNEPGHPSSPVGYAHHYLVDSFYGNDRDAKIRVTRDEKADNRVVECVRKIKLANLEIYCPKWPVDWRVTVSLECPVPLPDEPAVHTRRKDRLSYKHEEFSVDLTQVHATEGGATKLCHELELEILRPELIMSLAAKRGDPKASEVERSGFNELIRVFVNNARILVKNACEP